MLDIRPAQPEELETVYAFYNEVIDAHADSPQSPRWTRDVYPSREDLSAHIRAGRMLLGFWDGALAAAAALGESDVPGYENVPWGVEAAAAEVQVLHLLAVSPRFLRRGLGREMVSEALHLARSRGARALRLDVIRGNLPARRLYAALGFRTVGESRLYYEDTGWTDFTLMEYIF